MAKAFMSKGNKELLDCRPTSAILEARRILAETEHEKCYEDQDGGPAVEHRAVHYLAPWERKGACFVAMAESLAAFVEGE